MHYQTQAEMCATVFLIVVMVRFFSIRQFPDRKNRLFGVILACAVADLALDIISAYLIEAPGQFPIWANYLVNTLFYSIQVVFPTMMMTYALSMVGVGRILRTKYVWLYVPAAAFELLLAVNLFTGHTFRLEEINGVLTYVHAPMFYSLYAGSLFYLIATVVILKRNRECIKKDQYNVIISFIIIIIAAMIIQLANPELLITGVAIALAITMMFFTMQNPENMLDLISGVFNYEAMLEYIRMQIADGRPFRVIAMDIGGIRRINGAYGVHVGNEVLKQVGDFLNYESSRSCWAFRMMGTRFILITGEEDYSRLIENVELRFTRPWYADDRQFCLLATIRHFPQWRTFDTPQEVINLVDLAYTQYDDPGWGTTRACGAELLDMARRQIQVEEAIRRALDGERGFYLCYQPLYSVAEHRFVSAEALLRLEDSELGAVQPDEFITVAEKTGLIFAIDRVVVDTACDFLRRRTELKALGFSFLEVNFSAAEFGRSITELESHITEQGGVTPGMLCFEVTETATLKCEDELCGFMDRMNRRGYRFALDDFGTGYANIMRLANLPFDTVKMDRTMLVSSSPREKRVFADLLRMFKQAGLTTVVEGVETEAQYDRVEALGADLIQGYLFSRPLREDELMEFLRENNSNE